jgi:hypothetical protein
MSIKGTPISDQYTAILSENGLDFYHVDKGSWEKQETSDFHLSIEETEALYSFLFHALPIEELSEQPEMYLCPHCGQYHPIATKDYYCPLDPNKPKQERT